MKTPEEIKKCLEHCIKTGMACHMCAYEIRCLKVVRGKPVMQDALALIQQLESELAAIKRERDAAVSELPHHCWNCKYHLDKPIEETDGFGRTIHIYCEADCCYPDEENSSWLWRGVCPENTEVQGDE